jgi:NAD(P)-dependent dehydrogenase (short-subunit alcohol dehydrogenase family)
MTRILITGATDGLGRAVAAELAGRGAGVVVHGRDRAKVEAVAGEIGADGVLIADFASLADVQRMACEAPQVDVLVNNAGLIVPERRLTEDGNELTFQVNHLAHFLLTLHLLPPRIVNVASIGQRPVDFDDLTLERGFDGYDAYARSKLAQVMFTFELAERWPDLEVNALHPATLMDTKMVRERLGRPRSTVAEGVEATVRLVELDGVTGRFFDGLQESRANPQAYDAAARQRLWEVSEAATRRASSG